MSIPSTCTAPASRGHNVHRRRGALLRPRRRHLAGGQAGLLCPSDDRIRRRPTATVVSDASWLACSTAPTGRASTNAGSCARCRRSSTPGCIRTAGTRPASSPTPAGCRPQESNVSARQAGRVPADRLSRRGDRPVAEPADAPCGCAADSAHARERRARPAAGRRRPRRLAARPERLVRLARMPDSFTISRERCRETSRGTTATSLASCRRRPARGPGRRRHLRVRRADRRLAALHHRRARPARSSS